MSRLLWIISSATLIGGATLQAQNPFSTDVKAAYQSISNNILKAAEKMPDEDYSFKATPEVRNFGQLVAHVANAELAMCSIAKGEMKHGDAASKTSKADLIEALKAANEYCDGVYSAMTDAEGGAMVKAMGRERSKLGMLNFNVAHDNEMYGTMAVYLRLKGIVPPTSEGKSPKK
ncbi:MAG: DinB family protein [Bryobacteraceae bacterium]